MACTFNLFDRLTGTPQTGGTWSKDGGNPQDVVLTGAHLGTFDPSGLVLGTYTFTYSVGAVPCDDTADVVVTVNATAVAGDDVSKTYCTTDTTQYNLYNLITGSPDSDGDWQAGTSGVTSAGYDDNSTSTVTDDTFQPSLVAEGTYVFIYNVNHGDGNTPPGCDSCTDSSTLTINVVATGDAGGNGVATACN